MIVIVIHGAPAVGKLTVARELSKITGFAVLHNHLTIDLSVLLFPYGSPKFHELNRRLRFAILEAGVKEDVRGIIWTTGLPNLPEIRKTYHKLDRFIKEHNGSVHYVHLVCDQGELDRRVLGNSRKEFRKLRSVKQLRKNMREVDYSPGHLGSSSIQIDNSRLSPKKAALQITRDFSLRLISKKPRN
jgi:hypothetical protein